MFLNLLFQEPILFFIGIITIFFALSLHEFFHAFTADKMGDSTAKDLGRLTLNPLAHLDVIGLLCFLLVGFGWGKPVPYNPYNLKSQFQKIGPGIIAAAGPLSNLLFAIFCGIAMRLLFSFGFLMNNLLIVFLSINMLFNLVLFFFNLLPCPPLDGSKILFTFLSDRFENIKIFLEHNGPFVLLFLIILDRFFNFSIFENLFFLISKLTQLIVGFDFFSTI